MSPKLHNELEPRYSPQQERELKRLKHDEQEYARKPEHAQLVDGGSWKQQARKIIKLVNEFAE